MTQDSYLYFKFTVLQRIIAYTELIETCFDRKFYAFADRLQRKAIMR